MNAIRVKHIQERQLAPDVIRGFAIILVVWGHLVQQLYSSMINVYEVPMFRIIYSVHMPLFMLISGYFFIQ